MYAYIVTVSYLCVVFICIMGTMESIVLFGWGAASIFFAFITINVIGIGIWVLIDEIKK